MSLLNEIGELGITGQEFCKKWAKVTYSTIYRIDLGKSRPRRDTVAKIRKGFEKYKKANEQN
jgi:predicted transcriptional regulator